MNNNFNSNNKTNLFNQQSNNNGYMNNNQVYVTSEQLPKHKKVLKVIMIVSLILTIVLVGGFALVYTGVVRVGYVAPESILLNVNNIGVKKGKEYQYDYQVYPENSTAKNVYYESSDPSIADVNRLTGYVTPIKEGTVSISVKSTEDDKIVESSVLTVTNQKVGVTNIKLSSERIVFDLSNKSKSQLLKVSTEPYNATTQDLEFSSNDENVAVVDSTGRVFPVGFGMTTINVRTKDGSASGKTEVIVTDSKNKKVYFELPDKKKLIFPYSIQLDYSYLKLKYGESRKVGFILLPPDVTEDVVTWISSDPNVATVKDGLVTGIAIGQTTITARTVNDLVATLSVEVTDEEIAPKEVYFDKEPENLEIGESKVLSPRYDQEATTSEVTWSTTDPDVVGVDDDGNITAVGSGEAEITVTTKDGEQASQKVVVEELDETKLLAPKKSSITLETGKNENIQIETDSNYTNFIYRSSNEKIAVVNERGVLLGLEPGNVTITATTADGLSTEINVKVVDVPASKLTIVGKNNKVNVGSTLELECDVYPIDATNQTIEWKSSNSNILTVENGDVKGISTGTAIVTAKSGDLYNEFTVDVVPKNEKIEEQEDVIYKNTILNDSEKNELKKILLDYERIDEKNILFYLDLEKYGYLDFVNEEKTSFEILKQDNTLKNVKVSFINENPNVITPLAFNYEYTGYGVFTVKSTLTLETGEEIVLDISKVTIHELPVDGFQPVTITKEEEIVEDITTTASIKLKQGEVGIVSFTNYQEYANKITNWVSSDSSVATMDSSLRVQGKNLGTAKITGNYKNYKFVVKVTVKDKNTLYKKTVNKTFEYGKCYSLCSNTELKGRTNISKNTSKCSSSEPYYISEANHEYYYTCTSGNVETTYKGMSTGIPAVKTSNLKLNYANGVAVKKGEILNITILNWDELSLDSVTISDNITSSTRTLRSATFKLTVPKTTNLKTGIINFNAKSKTGASYSTKLAFNIIEPNANITSLECQKSVVMAKNSSSTLSCTMYDSNRHQVVLENPTYKSNNTSIVTVNNNGVITSKAKAGETTIKVSALGKEATVTVSVKNPQKYTAIEIKPQKVNFERSEIPSISYKLIGDDGVPTGDIPKIVYTSTNPGVAVVQDGKIIPRYVAGETTITVTATGDNVLGKSISDSVTIKINGAEPIESKVTKLECDDITVQVDKVAHMSCHYYTDISDIRMTVYSGASYKISNSSKATVDSNGNITGINAGTSNIKVEYEGQSCTANVEVVNNYKSLEISTDNPAVFNGYTSSANISYVLKYNSTSEATSGYSLNYEIVSGSDLINVTSSGKVTAKSTKTGIATVRASYKTKTGSTITSNTLSFYVNNNSKLIPKNIQCNNLTLYEGQTGSMICYLYYENASTITKLDNSNATFTPSIPVVANNLFSSRNGNQLTASVSNIRNDETTNFNVKLNDKNYNDITSTAKVTVKKLEVKAVSCKNNSFKLKKGDKETLQCSAIDNFGNEMKAELNYQSNNTGIVKISKNGEITTTGTGTATITVIPKDNKSVTSTVFVTVEDSFKNFKIWLEGGNTATIGSSGNVSIGYYVEDSTGKNVTNKVSLLFEVSGGSGVSINASNKSTLPKVVVTNGATPGKYTIKAKVQSATNQVSATTTLTVIAKPTSMKCDPVTVYKDKTGTISCKIYSGSSFIYANTSNAKYSIADDGGFLVFGKKFSLDGNVVKGLSEGSGTVKVVLKADKNISAISKVTVQDKIVYDTMSLTVSKSTLRPGESATLNCTMRDTDTNTSVPCDDVEYKNQGGANFTFSGNKITAQKNVTGVMSLKVRAVSKNHKNASGKNLEATVAITVRKEYYDKILITDMRSSLNVGEITTVHYQITDSATNKTKIDKDATITSSKTSVASVKGNKVTAIGEGTTTITVSYNGIKSTRNLTVKKKATTDDYNKVTITSMKSSIYVGDTTVLEYKLESTKSKKKKNNSGATVTSSNPSVASVTGRTIKGKSAGTATITVSYNGVSATRKITIANIKKVTCYSYYDTKVKYSCPSGYALKGTKCHRVISAKNKNYCLYVGGDSKRGTIKDRTYYNGKCLSTRTTKSATTTRTKKGSAKWTSSKQVAYSKTKIYKSTKQCNNSCVAKNC